MALAFGDLVELGHPRRQYAEGLGAAAVELVERGAPHLGDLGDVGRAALAALDLDRADADAGELGQQLEGVEAGRLLERVVGLVVDLEAALAQRRVAGALALGEAVDEDAVQARLHAARGVFPAHVLARRAGAVAVGGFAGGVGRQRAAPLDHHAQAAEAEDLDLDRGVGDHAFHLRHRQHARQHRTLDAEALVVPVDCLIAGGRSLNRQVQAQLRVGLRGVGHQPGVGEDQRVQAELGGAVDGLGPARPVAGLRVGVEREQDLAFARVGVGDALAHLRRVEVEAAEVARVGGVLEAEVDAVGAVIDGGLERRKAAGGADEFDRGRHGHGSGISRGKNAATINEAGGARVDNHQTRAPSSEGASRCRASPWERA